MRVIISQLSLRFLIAGPILALVSCGGDDVAAPGTGSIEVAVSTTGPAPDPDGYTLSIDGGAEVSIGVNATHRRDGLEPASHSVLLGGMAANCAVQGDNPRTVTVNAGATAQAAFNVTCSSGPQSSSKIAFLSSRDPGASPASDLYVMNPDGTGLQKLSVGQDVLSFDWSPDGRRIVFESFTDEEIYAVNVDGSGLVNLSNTPGIREGEPDWSPDGSRIAFLQDEDIHVMNQDGSGPREVVSGAFLWEWSPDGGKLAFLGRDDLGRDPDYYVINVDGSGEAKLTNSPLDSKLEAPFWSPDGQTIAFTAIPSDVFGFEIYLINPDGSNQRRLTNNEANDESPLWSPNGQRIAFNTDRDRGELFDSREIYLMNPDGSAQTNLTNTPGATDPELEDELLRGWSPDGSKILYERFGEIWVMNADGSGQTNLNQRGNDSAWSPQ